MDFMEVLKKRYSCKKFDGRKISKEQLDAILEAGRLAPTAKNLQEQKIYVVQSDEGLEKIDRITPCRYGAGTVLLVAFDRENVFVYPGGKRDSGVEDATIVATHMLLAAKAAGVESCWINFFDPEAAAKELHCRKRGGSDAVGLGVCGGGRQPSGESQPAQGAFRNREIYLKEKWS